MRILISDDHEPGRKSLRLILAAEGHEVIEAVDGQEALDMLGTSAVDVVISDILMPRMDGYRFCYEVRRRPGLQDLPIIIYTSTYTSPSEESLALYMGADRFLRKPSTTGEILQALSDVTSLPRKSTRDLGALDADLQVLKQYSERLVQKLEEKNLELEAAQAKLSGAYDKLERSERRFRELVEHAPIGIFQTAPDGLFIAANTAFARMLGYSSAQQLMGLDLARDVYADRADRASILAEMNRRDVVSDLEVRLKKQDGTPMWTQADGRVVKDPAGNVLRYEIFALDITKRKRAEEALRESEQRFRQVTEASDEVFWLTDVAKNHLMYVSPAYERVWGRSCESVSETPQGWLNSIHPEDEPRLRKAARKMHAAGEYDEEFRIVRPDGSIRWIHDRAFPIRNAKGEVYRVAGVAEDITERRRAATEMRRSEERFRRLFESNTIGITIADLAGTTLEANDAYLEMFGYTREDLAAGILRWDAMTPTEYRALDKTAAEALRRTGVSPPWEKEMLRKDGTRVPVLLGIAMLEASEANHCIAYMVDLSKMRQLENQFRQSQKMEAVGQLAGGVAHDFNNLLTAILGYTELAAARVVDDPEAFEELEEIRRAGERAAGLTRQLLAYSRRQVLAPRVLDLNVIVGDLENMLRRLIGEDIDLMTALCPSLGCVRADAGEIEQIILNLAVNSRDAMPQGGRITIETANVELDEAYAHRHISALPGRYVMLAVSDTGSGMDAETQSHIFEPFFTTKSKDKGTGLGLSTVYGIVKQSGGWIWVYSEAGTGTTLKIYLPEVDEAAELIPPSVQVPPTGGHETVLLAEDEEPVRKLARRVLEGLGYSVLEAARGEDAVSFARSHDGPIHLVLTDVVMPEMGGADLVARVQELRPKARVLFMSGYTDDAIIRHKMLERGTHFLQKPFTPTSLARKVREVLA